MAADEDNVENSTSDDDDEVDIGQALDKLEDILEDDDGLWTKISQDHLDELLLEHDRHMDGFLGAKRATLKFFDMSYLDFNGCNLTQADATGARFEHASMEDAIFMAGNFYAADMRFVSFMGSNLTRADLRGACLRGADFTDANLTEADLRDGLLM
ncbi:MAG: hypothetical protein HON14_16450, partial [Rhodospirillaceae bacterium]|nr:hypothetical protein [Rhodospirillaceae bacterium]